MSQYQGPQDPNQPQGPYQGPGQPPPGQPYYDPRMGPQQPGQPMTHAQAKAQARGAAAHAKAMRPWFKKKRFILPLALVALFIIVGIAGAGGNNAAPVAGAPASSQSEETAAPADDPTDEPTKKPTQKPADASAKIGDTVKAGDWSFKVTDFDCGKSKVGDQYAGKKAQGQFCFLKITAKNNGDSEGTLSGDSQKLTDDDGKTYSSDLEASLYEDSDSLLFLEGVNPGNTAKGTVIFDIPKKTKITSVTLTGGGLFADDAKVSLR